MSRITALAVLVVLTGCQQRSDPASCPTPSAGAANVGGSAQAGSDGAGTTSAAGTGGGTNGAAGSGDGGNAAAAATAGAGSGGTAGQAPNSNACSKVPLDQCQTMQDCAPLSGQRITGDPPCVALLEIVACGTSVGCTQQPMRATDPEGKDWIFPTACTPAGWTDSTQTGTRFDTCAEPMGAGGGSGGSAAGGTSGGGGGGSGG